MGDPSGCGPQITAEAWTHRATNQQAPFFVVGDPRLYQDQVPTQTIQSCAEAEEVYSDALPVLDITCPDFDNLTPGAPSKVFAPAIIESIGKATAFCLDGEASGIVTNPLSKSILYEAGFKFPGHTEFIADLCTKTIGSQCRPVMMLVGGGLRVALATIHEPLMRVAQLLTPDLLTEIAEITHRAVQRDFGIEEPRLAFSGLNPHAGEDGNIGTEERDVINPVARALRHRGIQITDARPGDTVFHEALNGTYDAVIAMTHDQGLIPVKTLDMWGGVNTTLGLPIVRTSPDHGTAYEAAAQRVCRPDSLLAALKLAETVATQRASDLV